MLSIDIKIRFFIKDESYCI